MSTWNIGNGEKVDEEEKNRVFRIVIDYDGRKRSEVKRVGRGE